MKTIVRRMLIMLLATALCLPAALAELQPENAVPSLPAEPVADAPVKALKSVYNGNPISSEIFCADPTAVEYEGRLYVYATNDHQQYIAKGADAENTYERIKSFVIFSTDDMVNWIYHGTIDTASIAPWVWASWAPSVISRVEADGLTHFYLYFSNSGAGVGVLTATNPLGPWTDPLGHMLVSAQTPGLTDCPQPFDPGAVIDDEGTGWLSFGGGVAPGGTDAMPGTARIVRLGSDLISLEGPIAQIPAPYFFEASELNYINGTFVYTYCSNWKERAEEPRIPVAGMDYMTTKTPLDPESWVFRGEYFKNPGRSGFDYSNNHTHLHKYQGTWYMIYHTMSLKAAMGIKGGYRSVCVNELPVDEERVTLTAVGGTSRGIVKPLKSVNPFETQPAASRAAGAGLSWNAPGYTLNMESGAWTRVAGVDFADAGAQGTFFAEVKGKGTLEVRLDSLTGETVAAVAFDSTQDFVTVQAPAALPDGTHDLYFVLSGKYIWFAAWQFAR